jgi:hypothetical protein
MEIQLSDGVMVISWPGILVLLLVAITILFTIGGIIYLAVSW